MNKLQIHGTALDYCELILEGDKQSFHFGVIVSADGNEEFFDVLIDDLEKVSKVEPGKGVYVDGPFNSYPTQEGRLWRLKAENIHFTS